MTLSRSTGWAKATFRKMGAPAAAVSVTTGGWIGTAIQDLISLTGLTDSRIGVIPETFTAPGGASFGEKWTPNAVAGTIDHGPGGANLHRGGVAVFAGGGGAALDTLKWAGPGLVTDATNEKWGIAFRIKCTVSPVAAGAAMVTRFGIDDVAGGSTCVFGISGAASQTNFAIVCSGAATVVASATIASFVGVEKKVVLIQKPVGGVRTLIAYVDGVEVARLNMPGVPGTFINRAPLIATNKGTWYIDDLVMVVDANE